MRRKNKGWVKGKESVIALTVRRAGVVSESRDELFLKNNVTPNPGINGEGKTQIENKSSETFNYRHRCSLGIRDL